MAEEFESVEIEVSEDDILYYLEDEDGNQVGFAVMEDGEEIEYFFEGDGDLYEIVEELPTEAEADGAGSDDLVELEISEDDIIYRIVDENDVEIGFAVMEDGEEVEYYYGEDEASEAVEAALVVDERKPAVDAGQSEEPEDHGYLYKMMTIAGHGADKTRKKAEVKIDKVRGSAEKQIDKATEAIEAEGAKLKEKRKESDLGITREDIAETTADLNVIAKEGAATAKELKAAYDEIMDDFGFLMPKKIRRRLP